MTTLADRAERAAQAEPDDTAKQLDAAAGLTPEHEELPDLSRWAPAGGEDWDMVPVHLAWLRVRRDIEFISKGDAYEEKGVFKYAFRGYERTVAAFGPVTLRHGVSVIPHRLTPSHRDATSGRGTAMRESTTKITWRVYGPLGDFLEMESEGESLDYSDKGAAKAQTIAQRVVLLIAGLIPTGAPDSDESGIERGEPPVRTAEEYRDEILDPHTSVARIEQIGYEIGRAQMLQIKVPNENGDQETLAALGFRIRNERKAAGQ